MHEGHRKRMLEKLTTAGDSLTDHELLEILLYNAYPRINTNTIAHELIDTFGSLDGVISADITSLLHVKNVGINCAEYINIFGRLITLSAKRENPMPKLFNFYDFKNYLKEHFKNLKNEEFILFFLDKRHKVLNEWTCSNLDDSMVKLDLKDISKLISINKPHSVVATHNHISGNEQPTKNDDSATNSLALLFNLNGVQFYDHIIIADEKFYSYHISGKLDEINKNFNIQNLSKNFSNGGSNT